MGDSSHLTGALPAEWEKVIQLFEKAWREQARPDIGHYLPTPRTGNTRLLFELIHVDLDLRLRRGDDYSGAARFSRQRRAST